MRKWNIEKILSLVMVPEDVKKHMKRHDVIVYHGINDYIDSMDPWEIVANDTTKTAIKTQIRDAIKAHTGKNGGFRPFDIMEDVTIIKYGNCYHFIQFWC